jgi:hypothetical protein
MALAIDEEFDVIVLCHTLSLEECDLSGADRSGTVARRKGRGPFRRTREVAPRPLIELCAALIGPGSFWIRSINLRLPSHLGDCLHLSPHREL